MNTMTMISLLVVALIILAHAAMNARHRQWKKDAALRAMQEALAAEQEWREKTIANGILRADAARAEALERAQTIVQTLDKQGREELARLLEQPVGAIDSRRNLQ